MLVYLFFLFQILIVIYLFYFMLSFLNGAPFVPTKSGTAGAMIELAAIKKGQTVYDLGSGDGRLLFMAAKLGAKTIGYEINPYLVLYTKIKILFSPYRKNIQVYWKNFWKAKLDNADIIFIYLIPWHMPGLQKRLLIAAPRGCIVISNSFIFPDWPITKEIADKHAFAFKIPKS